MESSKELFKPKYMSVLVLGIYLSNKKNNIEHIVQEFNTPCKWQIIQKWIALGGKAQTQDVSKVTVMEIEERIPKFLLLNKILSVQTLGVYDFVMICDDDIALPRAFIETYLDLVLRYDFALAQPARTHNSYIDWHFVEQLDGLTARRTRYVEIGPLFSVRQDAFSVIFPFDESVYMGWGCDFVWPCLMEKRALRMGIIDATPVDHSMRAPAKYYKHSRAAQSMEDYLSRKSNLSKSEAFRILESYA